MLGKDYLVISSEGSLNSMTTIQKLGRNGPCHCGSGRKYKKCCLSEDEARRDLASLQEENDTQNDSSVLEPFYRYFPDLAEKEGRVLWALGKEPGRDAPFGLVDFYCTDADCHCNRVMIGVVDHAKNLFRTILSVNYAFDRNDPDAGPFIDPLNPITEEGRQLYPMIKEMLEMDGEYVERLKRHYQMMKKISA